MPISKEKQKLYPGGSINSKEWKEIRARVLKRANNRCEGMHLFPNCRAENGKPHPETASKVVLTIAHLNHNPAESDDFNLKAMCQRCHLNYDARHHAQNAAATRRAKSAQRDMLDEVLK